MKIVKKIIFLSIYINTLAFGIHTSDNNIYYQEFKALKKEPFYKTLFDRRSNTILRSILSITQNAKEMSVMAQWFRYLLFDQSPVTISSSMMPKLYAYVQKTCQQQNMRMPTICITKNKTTILGFSTAHTDSTKLLMSSGAILIGQDLLLETSQKALEAAVAYQLAHIKYNHQNKYWLGYYIFPLLTSYLLPHNRPEDALFQVVNLLLPRILIGKRFEKQADAFVYKTMNNAEGLIELCHYFQHKKQRIEDDYADTYTFFQNANIDFFAYISALMAYYPRYIDHQFSNLYNWFCYNTILKAYQSNEARIKAAQQYLDSQKNLSA